MRKKVIILTAVIVVFVIAVGGYTVNESYKESRSIALNEYFEQLEICALFGLSYQTIEHPNGVSKIVDVSEGKYTFHKIHNYNEWVEMKTLQAGGIEYLDPRIRGVGNDGIITINDVLETPKALLAIWSTGGPMDNSVDRGYQNDIFSGPDYLFVMEHNGMIWLEQERKLTNEEKALYFESHGLQARF